MRTVQQRHSKRRRETWRKKLRGRLRRSGGWHAKKVSQKQGSRKEVMRLKLEGCVKLKIHSVT